MKYITLLFVFYFGFINSQKFDVEFEADYKLEYKLRNTQNALKREASFALLIGKNSSFFKNINHYVGDSLLYYKKIKKTGDPLKDMKTFHPYYSDFQENIGTTFFQIYVTMEINGNFFEYREPNNIKWKIENEKKIIGKMTCVKATTRKYGRNWTAYFTEEIPFNYGPYKFNGLPGLIIELFDDKKDFYYTLYKFKKRKFTSQSANMYTNPTLVSKNKIFDYYKKNIQNPNRFKQIIDDPEVLRELQEKSAKLAREYNPLELEID